MDRFPADLSYCLHLLIGFDGVEADHGGRLSAMGGVGPLVVVAKRSNPRRRPWPAIRSPKRADRRIHTSGIATGAQSAPTGDCVQSPTGKMVSRQRPLPSMHCRQAIACNRREGGPGADPFQSVYPGEGRELGAPPPPSRALEMPCQATGRRLHAICREGAGR